ncbi:unnamed protein product [Arabidopsis halleri]
MVFIIIGDVKRLFWWQDSRQLGPQSLGPVVVTAQVWRLRFVEVSQICFRLGSQVSRVLVAVRSDRDLICSMVSFEAFYNRVPSISPYPGVML